jgi:5-methylcytosine-specific restriction endonuclease McrA
MGRNDGKNICLLDEFKDIVASSKSKSEICEKLKERGYDNRSLTAVNKRIAYENISTEHLKGKQWNKNSFDYSKLVKGNRVTSTYASRGLILKRGHRCECCGLTKWLDMDITLEVHHIDGDKLNNDEDNLSLLCPNCHALTDTFRGRNMQKTYVSDIEFADALRQSKNVRQALLKLNLTPKGANYKRAYDIAMRYSIEHILEP